jgi:hypothetical protein
MREQTMNVLRLALVNFEELFFNLLIFRYAVQDGNN